MKRLTWSTLSIVLIIFVISFSACKKDTEVTSTGTESELISEDTTNVVGDDILGCTDPTADNFNSDATLDDGSCTYTAVSGCTDPAAENYNSDATEDDGSCTYPISSNANIGDLMAAFAPENQLETFNFNEDLGGMIVTSLGTRFIFYPNSLATLDNQSVDGMVTVEIIELFTKGDIIRYGAQTLANNGQLLESGGEFLVKAYQNGQELKVANGNSYNIQVPNVSPNVNMQFFDLDDSGNLPEWVPVEPNTQTNWVQPGEWEDSTAADGFGWGYYIITDRFDWINCDAYVTYPPDQVTNISVTVPEGYTNVNTGVFLVFSDSNLSDDPIVVQLWGDPTTMMFTSPLLPIGFDATIIVMSSVGDDANPQFQYEVIDITIEADQVINSVPVDATIEEIEMALDGI